MNALKIILKYYTISRQARDVLIRHSEDVANKALQIAGCHPELNLDMQFIEEAAMIHDIGIFMCNAPEIGCKGEAEYICHGYLGYELMKKEGFPAHALVCERHTGAGITAEEIIKNKLPIPNRDMLPISLEEQLICYADKFFGKTDLGKEKSLEKIRKGLSKYGEASLLRFENMHRLFG